MNVLFTPIGNTDPITNYLDGAMLHICRHCAIDKVIMYLSKDICAIHKKDNRYVAMVQKLARFQNRTIECEIIEKEDLEDVHIFDYFIEEFNNILNEIEERHPGDILYLNVSSGTPAMKSALQALAYFRPRSYNIIQVTGGGYSEQRREFDIRTAFETDKDNDPDAAHRILRSQNKNLIKQSVKKSIAALIEQYDYSGALITAKGNGICDKRFITALEATDMRYKFFLDDAKELYKQAGLDIEFKSDIEEYLLILGIKKDRRDYADFMRAITPLVYELDKLILKTECGFDVDLCVNRSEEGEVWDLDLLERSANAIDNLVYRFLTEKYNNLRTVYSSHLHYLITKLSTNGEVVELSETIRRIERKRNNTAHRLDETVSKAYIDKAKPLTKLFDACVLTGLITIPNGVEKNDCRQAFFNEYIRINKQLKELLSKC